MSSTTHLPPYFVGWDVGGWNCDKNGKSRDAIAILDSELQQVGKPWRGNLTGTLNAARDSSDLIGKLFLLCGYPAPGGQTSVTLAIDTPLGFSLAFQKLVTCLEATGPIGKSAGNPYLFRQTEKFLFHYGLSPLSAVKDMIGSQATKGMHVLARFAPSVTSCGVWSDGQTLTVIEAYPSACKGSTTISDLKRGFDLESLGHDDQRDAIVCALIAHLHARDHGVLAAPPPETSPSEGWIWVPRDALKSPAEKLER